MFYFSAKPEERCLTHIIDCLEASYGARPRAVTWISTDFRGKTQCATAEVLAHCLKERLLLEALGFLSFSKLVLASDVLCSAVQWGTGRGLTCIQASLSEQALGASVYQCSVCNGKEGLPASQCADQFRNEAILQKFCGWSGKAAQASWITCFQHGLPGCRGH